MFYSYSYSYSYSYFNANVSSLNIETPEQLLEEQIWGNYNFTLFDTKKKIYKPLIFKNWINSEIICVKDLQIVDGKINTEYLFQIIQNKRNIYIEIKEVFEALHKYNNILSSIHNKNL